MLVSIFHTEAVGASVTKNDCYDTRWLCRHLCNRVLHSRQPRMLQVSQGDILWAECLEDLLMLRGLFHCPVVALI